MATTATMAIVQSTDRGSSRHPWLAGTSGRAARTGGTAVVPLPGGG